MRPKLTKYISIWVLLGALSVASGLLVVWGLFLLLLHSPQVSQTLPTAELSIIPPPTMMPMTIAITETPLPKPVPEIVTLDGISKGIYVQIFETGTAGLRLRNGPGINEDIHFLAPEGEVYLVEDGPRDVDDYIWWYLVAPYDQARSGWAVSRYLKPVSATSQ